MDKTEETCVCQVRGMADAFPFTIERATLVCRAQPPKRGERAGMDEWRVTLKEGLYGGTMDITYSMGVGHRDGGWKGKPANLPLVIKTTGDEDAWRASRPVAPTVRDVLISIGGDLGTAYELPSDDVNALDYLAEELGFTKPGDALRCLRALRQERDDAAKMLRGTGLDVNDFAEWCRSLDA